jgi:type VI protein secretion system component VasF
MRTATCSSCSTWCWRSASRAATRVIENGRAQLDSVRERLVQMLRQSRGTYEKALSPRWQGVEQRVARLHEGCRSG